MSSHLASTSFTANKMYPLSEILQNFKSHYSPVTGHDGEKYVEDELDVEEWQSRIPQQPDRSWRWIALSGVLAVLNIIQLLYPYMLPPLGIGHPQDAFSIGFSTDFGMVNTCVL